MNYRMIRNILGWLLIFECGFMLVPTVTALIYGEREIWAFLVTMLLCGGIGALCVWRKPKDSALYAREGFVIVSLSWILLSLFGAIPFCISGVIPNYVDAVFETVSGLPPRVPPSSPPWSLCPVVCSCGAASPTGWGAWACWSSLWPSSPCRAGRICTS